MTILQIQKLAYETSEEKGWHDDLLRDKNGNLHTAQLLALLHLAESEISESELEDELFYVGQYGKPEGWIIELADVVIRLCDTRQVLGFETSVEVGGPMQNRKLHHSIYRIGDVARVQPVTSPLIDDKIKVAISDVYAEARKFCVKCDKFEHFIAIKQEYNKTRTRRHGGKLA